MQTPDEFVKREIEITEKQVFFERNFFFMPFMVFFNKNTYKYTR